MKIASKIVFYFIILAFELSAMMDKPELVVRPVVTSDIVLTDETQQKVFAYCEHLAKQVGASGITFDLKDYKSLCQNVSGSYNKYDRCIRLSEFTQKIILGQADRNITNATVTLLHELGHDHSAIHGIKARRDDIILGSSLIPQLFVSYAVFVAISSKVLNKIESLEEIATPSIAFYIGSAAMGLAGSIFAFLKTGKCVSEFFEERFADRYAAEKLVQIYGFDHAQCALQMLHKDYPNSGKFFNGGLKGYQGYDSLLRHIQRQQHERS